MKKFLAFVLTFMLVLSLMPGVVLADAIGDWNTETEADYYVEVSAPDGYVNIRTGPDTSYDIMDKGYNGEVYHVIAEYVRGSWVQIEFDGRIGWVALSQVERTSAPAASTPKPQSVYSGGKACDYSVVVNAPDGGVNLRFGPSTDYDIRISMIPNGTLLHVRAEEGRWGRTTHNGTDGWIALSQTSEYVPVEEEIELPEVTATAAPTQAVINTPAAATQTPDKNQEASNLVAEMQNQQHVEVVTEAKAGMGFMGKLILIVVIVFVVVLAAVILLCVWMKKTQRTDLFEDYDGYGQQTQGYEPYAESYEGYTEGAYEGEYAEDAYEEYEQYEETYEEAYEEVTEEAAEEIVEVPAEETAEEPAQEPVQEPVEEAPAEPVVEEPVAVEEPAQPVVEEKAAPVEPVVLTDEKKSVTKATIKTANEEGGKDLKKKF